MVGGNNESTPIKNVGRIAGNFRLPCRRGGMTQGTSPDGARPELHWKPLDAKCLRRIAPAAAMVNEFIETAQNTNKTQLLASNYSTFRALINSENFIPQNRPSTQLIDATSFVSMWNATIGAEELVIISIYQTLSADKK